MLVDHMQRYPWLSEAFRGDKNSPADLIERFRQPKRESVSREELIQIAQVKVARGMGRARIRVWIEKTCDAEIREISAQAFAQASPSDAVRNLTAIEGVGVPVASAVLSWCFPSRWAVIDWRSWNTLVAYERLPGRRARKPNSTPRFTPNEYGAYMQQVLQLADATRLEPQRIDRWLYAFNRCELAPAHLN